MNLAVLHLFPRLTRSSFDQSLHPTFPAYRSQNFLGHTTHNAITPPHHHFNFNVDFVSPCVQDERTHVSVMPFFSSTCNSDSFQTETCSNTSDDVRCCRGEGGCQVKPGMYYFRKNFVVSTMEVCRFAVTKQKSIRGRNATWILSLLPHR